MTPEMISKLRRSLEDWINEHFVDDMKYFYAKLSEDFYWFEGLEEGRQAVIIELCALMGYKNLCGLVQFLYAIECKDFYIAARDLMNGNISQQTKGRSSHLADIMATGVYAI